MGRNGADGLPGPSVADPLFNATAAHRTLIVLLLPITDVAAAADTSSAPRDADSEAHDWNNSVSLNLSSLHVVFIRRFVVYCLQQISK